MVTYCHARRYCRQGWGLRQQSDIDRVTMLASEGLAQTAEYLSFIYRS